MSWIPLHDSIFTDDWLNSLTEAERWAYVSFCLNARAQTPKWRVKKCSLVNLGRVFNVRVEVMESMFRAAIEAQKILDEEDAWVLKNGKKYDFDDTNSERQKRYRERKQHDSILNSNGNVTVVTESNASNGIRHNITEHNRTENERAKALSQKAANAAARLAEAEEVKCYITTWNAEKLEAWPTCNFDQLQAAPKKVLTTRLRRAGPDFDLSKILNIARASPFLQTARFFNLLWLVSAKDGELNYQKVLNGKYDSGNSKSANSNSPRAGNLLPSKIKF